MPGSKENAKAKDIFDYIRQHKLKVLFFSLKPGENTCYLVCKDTGKVLLSTSKNYKVMEYLTDPKYDFTKTAKKKGGFALNITEAVCLNTIADNAAVQIKKWVKTLMEAHGTDELPTIKKTPTSDGYYEIEIISSGIKLPITKVKMKESMV